MRCLLSLLATYFVGGAPTHEVRLERAVGPFQTISGVVRDGDAIGMAGVTLAGFPTVVVSAMDGSYSASVPTGWSGRVAPQLAGFGFVPPQRSHASVLQNVTGQDYQAPSARTISGQVRDSSTQAIGGVSLLGFPTEVTTDPSGSYKTSVPSGWSGTVVPSLGGSAFTPFQRQYDAVVRSVGSDDYLAMHAIETQAQTYGPSCGPLLRIATPPMAGTWLLLSMRDLPGNSMVAYCAFGLSSARLGSMALPMPLGAFGMPGCWLLQDLALQTATPMTLSGLTADASVWIPSHPTFLGFEMLAQGWAIAPGANNAGVVTSNGLFLHIGVPTQHLPVLISQTFADARNLDPLVSANTWAGGARSGRIGGDGRHGSFVPTLGTQVGPGEYEWSTDFFVIPASHSLTGQTIWVTDGRFYFTDFVLPESTTVRFTGSAPAQIWVRGQAVVRGNLMVNAPAMPFWVPTSGPAAGLHTADFDGRGSTLTPAPYVAGQPGGAPGAGGGRGGRGGGECQGNGYMSPNDGQDGESVRLTAGHAYAGSAPGTGGRGSRLNPPTGIAQPNTPLLGNAYRAFFAPGGSGGGFHGPGGTPSVTPTTNLQIGPAPPTGNLFSLWPCPVNAASLDHYLVGGSGGGGGGSHAFGTNHMSGDVYIAGGGGSGGGGALALRAGADLTVEATAILEARGGVGALITGDARTSPAADTDWGVSSPGGGGSGGSVLLQSGGTLAMHGTLDTRGGIGSRTGSISLAAIDVASQAGDGSSGSYRLEAATTPTFTGVGWPTYSPTTNAGLLSDRDARTGCSSRWYATSHGFPPTWLRYELDVDTDGNGINDVTYSDSGLPGTQLANDPTGPVMILFQGAQVLASSRLPVQGTVGPWRTGVGDGAAPGISLDAATGYRFQLTFNQAQFPNCVVRELRIYAVL